MIQKWLELNWKIVLLLAAAIPIVVLNVLTIQLVDSKIIRLSSEQVGIVALQRISCLWDAEEIENALKPCETEVEQAVASLSTILDLSSDLQLNVTQLKELLPSMIARISSDSSFKVSKEYSGPRCLDSSAPVVS
jgi:hypothetical protein